MENVQRKTELALKIYESTQELIRFADTKINLLSVINGIASSYIFTNFQQVFSISLFSKIVLILYLTTFIVFIYYLLNTILPRSGKYTDVLGSQIIYFGHISGRSNVKDFIDDFHKTDSVQFLDDLLQQIYESSKIASSKFSNYKKSLITLQVQIFLFFILLGLKSFLD